jgi:hypothetical protein
MIRREHGECVAECDECGATTEGVIEGIDSLPAFVAEIKGQGWVVRQDDDGDWVHYCGSDCAD